MNYLKTGYGCHGNPEKCCLVKFLTGFHKNLNCKSIAPEEHHFSEGALCAPWLCDSEKILDWIGLKRLTIFLKCSSASHTSFKISWLPEPKYAIFSRTGRKTKKLRRLNLFTSAIFKHRLLDGSTFSFLYSSTGCTPLESSRLRELKYAISAG